MKIYITFSEIQAEIAKRQDIISELNTFNKVIVITRGGLVVAGLLSSYLNTRWYDTVSIKSYEGENQKEFEILKLTPTDDRVLIIEDIVDTGKTAEFLKSKFPNSKFFALHYKSQKSSYKPDYFLWETNDWIVYPWEV